MKRVLVLALVAACQADPRVGVVAQASFVADPASYDFGSIPVGNSDATTLVISTPDDGDDLVITTSTCTDFSFSLPTDTHITSTEPLAFDVTFTPTSAGAFACDLTFTGNDGEQVVSLVGTGTVDHPVATVVTPTSLEMAFGEIPVAVTSAVQSIEVRNDGAAPLDVQLVGETGDSGFAIVAGSGATPVDPGSSISWDVTCTPPVDGNGTHTYSFSTDDPDLSAFDIAVTCTGVTTAVYVTPAPAVYGEILLGGSLQMAFDLNSVGASVDTVVSTTFDTSGPGTFTNDDLDPGMNVQPSSSIPFHVTFTPTDDGDVASTMTVTMTSGAVSNVSLIGRGATAILSITPPDPVIVFDTVCVGQMSAPIRVSLRNAGTGAFQVNGVQNLPGDVHPFTGNSSGFPVTLPAGATVLSYSDEVFFPDAPGEIDGTFRVNTNIPGDEQHLVALHGRALDAVVGGTELAHDFGSVGVGADSSADDLGVINCSPGSVTVAVALSGDDADAFQILPPDPTDGVDVAMGATSTWSTQFRPTHQGAHVATFTITWDAGSIEIPLTGLGVVDLVPDDGRGSYLACSSGGAGAAWPVLLALLLLRRRSRRV